MRILVSIPSVSDKFLDTEEAEAFLDSAPFCPTGRTLDVFATELAKLKVDKLFGVNIPHWTLQGDDQGISGPGAGPLWVPPSLEKKFSVRAGVYDKWRPYPAEPPLSRYNINMAKRFSGKRYRMFAMAADDMRWETLFYVEHSPASLAHLSEKEALKIARKVVRHVSRVALSMPYVDVVIFSPYGTGRKKGFVLSNRIEASDLDTWPKIKAYLKGQI